MMYSCFFSIFGCWISQRALTRMLLINVCKIPTIRPRWFSKPSSRMIRYVCMYFLITPLTLVSVMSFSCPRSDLKFPLECRFRDPRSHRCHHAQVGFQVCVRPGSYKAGPQTFSTSEPLDPRFGNSEIEWITKEQGGTLLYGLLIRVE